MKELEYIKSTSIENMWKNELDKLKIAYKEFLDSSNQNVNTTSIKKSKTKKS